MIKLPAQSRRCCLFFQNINAVAVAPNDKFIVSASQDKTAKVINLVYWIQNMKFIDASDLSVYQTELEFQLHLNKILGYFLNSGYVLQTFIFYSQIFKLKSGGIVGVLRGHKRGIWCVRFSPIDKCIVTASADSTIKLWALNDFTCVKVLNNLKSSLDNISSQYNVLDK